MSRPGTTKFSARFLDVEDFPDIKFRSSGVRSEGSWDIVDGELSIRGVTRPMALDVELNGFTPDLHGDLQAGSSASSLITDGYALSPGAGAICASIVDSLEESGHRVVVIDPSGPIPCDLGTEASARKAAAEVLA